jgi:hypothetical protein
MRGRKSTHVPRAFTELQFVNAFGRTGLSSDMVILPDLKQASKA